MFVLSFQLRQKNNKFALKLLQDAFCFYFGKCKKKNLSLTLYDRRWESVKKYWWERAFLGMFSPIATLFYIKAPETSYFSALLKSSFIYQYQHFDISILFQCYPDISYHIDWETV